jgi:hypothetical protein
MLKSGVGVLSCDSSANPGGEKQKLKVMIAASREVWIILSRHGRFVKEED